MAQMAYLTQILVDHPVALWALTDAVGAASVADINPTEFNPLNPGTPANVTFGVAGPVSGLTAASFNGTTSDVSIPYSSLLAPAPKFTGEILFNMTAFASANAAPLEARLNTTNGFCIFVSNAGAVLAEVGGGAGQIQLTGPTITTGTWHLAQVTYDGTAASLWLDGTRRVGPSVMNYSPNPSQAIHLGRNIGGGIFLNGKLAFGAIYNYDLSAAQVAAHYDAWQNPAAEIYVPFPTGFQPWDIAASFGGLAAWYTECYQGGGLGTVPTVGKDVIVALAPGQPAIKYWAYPSAINPAG